MGLSAVHHHVTGTGSQLLWSVIIVAIIIAFIFLLLHLLGRRGRKSRT